jgi:tetratricopeptide (TPR) repeat protein
MTGMKRWMIVTVAVLIVVLGAASLTVWLNRPQLPLYVALMTPMVSEEDNQQLDRAAMAVSVAALDTLSALDQVYTIEPRHLAAVAGGTAEQVTRALAADEVLASQVSEQDGEVQVTISRTDHTGKELWSEAISGSGDPDQLILTVQEALLRAYDDRKKRRTAHRSTATAKDYETYLEIKSVLRSAPKPMEYSTAMARLKHVRESSPGLLGAYFMEASIGAYLYRITRNEQYLEQGREALEEAGKVAPGDYRVMMAEVEMTLAVGDLDKAEKYINELRELAPGHQYLPLFIAELLEYRGDEAAAISVLKEDIAKKPSWISLRDLGAMELRNGAIESAKEHLAAAVDLAPGYAPLLAKAAEVELIYGDPARAEQMLVTAVSKTSNTLYMTNLGTAFMLRGDYSKALLTYQQAYRLGSLNPGLLMNLGDAHSLLGDDVEAKEHYLRAYESLPEDGSDEIVAYRAYCLSRVGRVDEALSMIRPVAQMCADESVDVAYMAAIVFGRIGLASESNRYLEKARTLGLSNAWIELSTSLDDGQPPS